MPSITFNGLQKVATTTKQTYIDVQLDFDNPVQRDIKADYDVTAIGNSLTNLFNTIPGQNLLNPDYGLNLMQFVFESATDTTAQLIAQTIMNNVQVYEPRVTIKTIDIIVNPEAQTFDITLSIVIPSLNAQFDLPGTLSKTGYTLL
jgi:uncharacterized protein